jgi:tetratricopeptide (TPR) repeat protein
VHVGLFLTDVVPTRIPSMIRLSREDIDIAPGQREYVLEDRYVLPVDVEVHELQPHAHLLARRVEAEADLPDGTTRSLLRIADWDFRWQDVYRLKEPLRLPAGTALRLRITYDNSTDNPRNPFSPPRRVQFGENTSDEMGALWLQVLPRSPRDLATLQRDVDRKSMAEDVIGYRHLLAAASNNPGLHEALASSYLRLGNGAEALKELEASVRLDPRSAMGQYNLGTALLVQGRSDEALAHFTEAIRLKPSLASAHNSLGVALKAKGRVDEAIAHYRQALAIDPEYAHARNNLGAALQALGHVDEAIAQYALAVQANPTDPVPHRNWAKALAIHGDAAQATARFRGALVVAPDSPLLLAELAWLLAVHPDARIRASGESVELAERASMLTGAREPAVLDVLAAAYAGAGRFDQAIAVARSAIAFASQRHSKRLAVEIERRLRLYETHRAYTHAFAGGFGR